MKRRSFLKGSVSAAVLLSLLPAISQTAQAADLVRGRPARLVLVTGGSYVRYRRILLDVATGLEALELIEHAPDPADFAQDAEGTADVWAVLAAKAGGSRFEFLPDGHYDYGFTETGREKARAALFECIRTRGDVDMILVFGTESTKDIAREVKHIPIVSLGSSDPVRTGVVRSAEDSGQDNLHAIVVTDYYAWQTRSFHSVHPFKRLGFVIAASRNDKSGEPEIRSACESLKASLVYKTYEETGSGDKDDAAFVASIDALIAEGVDAVMLPWVSASDDALYAVLTKLAEHGIPSFSQSGPDFVERGVLLGVGEESFEGYGFFEAEVFLRILEGESPRQIPQAYAQRGRLVVNLKTAMQLGWQPPFSLLVAAEKVWTTQSASEE